MYIEASVAPGCRSARNNLYSYDTKRLSGLEPYLLPVPFPVSDSVSFPVSFPVSDSVSFPVPFPVSNSVPFPVPFPVPFHISDSIP